MENAKSFPFEFDDRCGFFYGFRLQADDGCQIVDQHRLRVPFHLDGQDGAVRRVVIQTCDPELVTDFQAGGHPLRFGFRPQVVDVFGQGGQPRPNIEISDPEGDRLASYQDGAVRSRLSDEKRGIFRLEFHLGTLPQLRIFALEPSMKEALRKSLGARRRAEGEGDGCPLEIFPADREAGGSFSRTWSSSPTASSTRHNSSSPMFSPLLSMRLSFSRRNPARAASSCCDMPSFRRREANTG